MRAITFQAVETLTYGDVRDPVLRAPTDVVVEVTAAGVCGSDLHPYFGRETGLDPGTVMGHEFVGRVRDVGPAVATLAVGDRVVAPFTTSCDACFYCRSGLTARCELGQLFGWVEDGTGLHGSQAELVRVPMADTTLVHVPDALADDAVALLAGDVLATALFGADLAGVAEGDLVAVVGCGPVGLLAVRTVLERGARQVVAVDRVASRLALAARFGATPAHVDAGDPGGEHAAATPRAASVGNTPSDPRSADGDANPGAGADPEAGGGAPGAEPGAGPLELVRALSEGRGADRVIEAVGTPQATRTAADLLRPGGSLAALGVHTEPHLALPPGEIYDRNLRYAGGRCPARHYLPEALALAERQAALLETLVSHRLPLAEGVEAYRMFAERREGCTKVVLSP